MNIDQIVTLITAITALIGAISGLIILIVHIVRHQPLPGDNPPNSSAKPSLITPPPNDNWPH